MSLVWHSFSQALDSVCSTWSPLCVPGSERRPSRATPGARSMPGVVQSSADCQHFLKDWVWKQHYFSTPSFTITPRPADKRFDKSQTWLLMFFIIIIYIMMLITDYLLSSFCLKRTQVTIPPNFGLRRLTRVPLHVKKNFTSSRGSSSTFFCPHDKNSLGKHTSLQLPEQLLKIVLHLLLSLIQSFKKYSVLVGFFCTSNYFSSLPA